MFYSHGTNRPKGGYQRRTLIALAFLLLGSAAFFASAVTSRAIPAGDSPVAVKAVAAAAPVVDFKTLDLFAAIEQRRSHVLTNYDRALYEKIFAAQSKGDWSQANALIKRLHNSLLMGHVLFDRYIRSADYKASYDELRTWMVAYGDHPDAYKVYQLAQKRRHNDPSRLPAPQMAKRLLGTLEFSWFNKDTTPQPKGNVPRGRNAGDVRRLMVDIRDRLSNDQVTVAYNLLGRSPAARMLTNVEYDSLLGEISAAYYYAGKFDAALRVANQAIKRSDRGVPVAHWIAGLASWQQEEYADAAKHFAAINNSYSRNPWMLSAAAFWAARS